MLRIKYIPRITILLFFNETSLSRVAIETDSQEGNLLDYLVISYLLI